MKLTTEDIIYEDNDIIVCHKPSGIATQTAKLGEADMESALKNYLKVPYIGVVHRLDQPVEGILVFAKTKKAAANLSAQSSAGIMSKNYYAVVAADEQIRKAFETENVYGADACQEQNGAGKEHVLVDYLVRNGRDNTSRAVAKGTRDAKRSELIWQMMKVLPEDSDRGALEVQSGKSDSRLPTVQPVDSGSRLVPMLVRIQLKTGRHHQIRVQMSHAGMPLLGDAKYGNEVSKQFSREQGVTSVALCAYGLSFVHPVTGKQMDFELQPSGKAFLPFLPWNP